MSKAKKILKSVTAGLLMASVLTCASACDSSMLGLIPWLETQIGGEVTVHMAGWNAYTYNGERYVHTSEMDNFETFNGYIASREDEPIGYGYNPMFIKNPVFADAESNVIVFGGYFFGEFYVKESIEIPPLLEIEFSSIGTTDIKFQLKDVVSEEMDFDTLQETKILDRLGRESFYFLPGGSLCANFEIYRDVVGTIYLAGDPFYNDFGCYEVVNEGFKQLLVDICTESA